MDRQRRNTKKYNFRQPDLKKLRSLTSYVLDPLEFKSRHGKLLSILATQLLLTLEEYAYLVGIPILDQLSFNGLERVPTSQEIADLLHIGAHMTTKVGIQGLPSNFLIAQITLYGKAMSEDAFEAIFVLLIYGLVLFPNIDKFVDVNAIRIFYTLNPVPTLLGDTYFSFHMRNAKGGGTIVCCLPLLYKWFISHLPQTVAFKENKGSLGWSMRLMSLTNDDIFWYNRVYDGVQIIDSCDEFSNVPPLEGKDPQGLKGRMVCAWRKIHRKRRKELGPKNCIALEPYTSWVRRRASEYLIPYDYLRPTPMVVAGTSTLSDQGVEELRYEDRSRAWIRE
ncbi:hypothetical protein KIW84_020329 [Lathyrus oleraceus]|uniref:DUF7745 domain-containing protein n=1 Tax=Pisum sativum TaxID=3888 RepID=A0A9D4Y606_PEA|nr:hypothetical protein KIW84_020329 [Pisum sativum]